MELDHKDEIPWMFLGFLFLVKILSALFVVRNGVFVECLREFSWGICKHFFHPVRESNGYQLKFSSVNNTVNRILSRCFLTREFSERTFENIIMHNLHTHTRVTNSRVQKQIKTNFEHILMKLLVN